MAAQAAAKEASKLAAEAADRAAAEKAEEETAQQEAEAAAQAAAATTRVLQVIWKSWTGREALSGLPTMLPTPSQCGSSLFSGASGTRIGRGPKTALRFFETQSAQLRESDARDED